MVAKLIEKLLDSRVYPHPVTKTSLIETHISWVILTGHYAYKIKKPVNLGFLDFSSLDMRKHYCEEELRLNRRFSEDIYVDVIAITGSPDHPHIGGAGQVLDYAVKMVEFSQDALLINQIQQVGLSKQQIERLARQLSAFHRRSSQVPPGDTRPAYGSMEAIQQPVMENFEQIRPLLDQETDRYQLEQLETWSMREIERLANVIETRRENGFIRECHGDLHLSNIAVINDAITFFDCIEFNDQLRWIDTCSELAYLIMDLERCGHFQWGAQIVNHYLEQTGDFGALKLLKFYKVYRALVRAKVSLFQVPQAGQDGCEADSTEAYSLFRHYIELAVHYIEQTEPVLLITHGLSGSGKSTVSDPVSARLPAIRLRSDVERKRLFGLKPNERSQSTVKGGIYSKAATDQTFSHLRQLAAEILSSGYSVVVDAAFLAKAERQKFMQLASELSIPFIIIDCQLDQQTLIDRLKKRSQNPDEVSEAGVEVMQSQLNFQERLDEEEQVHTLSVNTRENMQLEVLMERIKKFKVNYQRSI